MNHNYSMTDDPNDPCGYCVQWIEQADDVLGENAVPVLPSGPVDRLYRWAHDDCFKSVVAYSTETAL